MRLELNGLSWKYHLHLGGDSASFLEQTLMKLQF